MDNSKRARANEALRLANKALAEAKCYAAELKVSKLERAHNLFMFQSSMKRYRMATRLAKGIIG